MVWLKIMSRNILTRYTFQDYVEEDLCFLQQTIAIAIHSILKKIQAYGTFNLLTRLLVHKKETTFFIQSTECTSFSFPTMSNLKLTLFYCRNYLYRFHMGEARDSRRSFNGVNAKIVYTFSPYAGTGDKPFHTFIGGYFTHPWAIFLRYLQKTRVSLQCWYLSIWSVYYNNVCIRGFLVQLKFSTLSPRGSHVVLPSVNWKVLSTLWLLTAKSIAEFIVDYQSSLCNA